MKTFVLELFGTVDLPTYLAWVILSILGAITATLIRNHIPTLKSFPINSVQLLTVFLITFVFIRFSLELTGFVPNAFGAFLIGLSGNEIALGLLKKFLQKKKDEKIQAFDDPSDLPPTGGGAGTPDKAP